MKHEPFKPTQADEEEKATIEYLRSMKLIRRVAPGMFFVLCIVAKGVYLMCSDL